VIVVAHVPGKGRALPSTDAGRVAVWLRMMKGSKVTAPLASWMVSRVNLNPPVIGGVAGAGCRPRLVRLLPLQRYYRPDG